MLITRPRISLGAIGRRGSGADFAHRQCAGATRFVDEQNAVAIVVNPRLDVGRSGCVNAVDHVANRLRFVAERVQVHGANMPSAVGDTNVVRIDAIAIVR